MSDARNLPEEIQPKNTDQTQDNTKVDDNASAVKAEKTALSGFQRETTESNSDPEVQKTLLATARLPYQLGEKQTDAELRAELPEFKSMKDLVEKTQQLLCTRCAAFDFSGQIRQVVDQLQQRQMGATGDNQVAATQTPPVEVARSVSVTPGAPGTGGRPAEFMGDAAPTAPPPVGEEDIGAPMPGGGDDGLPAQAFDAPQAREAGGPVRDAAHERPNGRDIDPGKDNPAAVQQRYHQELERMVREGKLSQRDAASMERDFNTYMRNMEGKYSAEDMSRICSSMNRIMDSNRMSDMSKLNACVDLASKGDNARDSNGQGAHNTCAPTSLSRILQQKDFAAYSEQIASVAETGSAWVGDKNHRQRVTIDNLNFAPDRESGAPWSADRARNGQRGMAGQLDNALYGQYMADLKGENDRCRYTYLAAHADRVGVKPDQSQSNEALIRENRDGTRTFVAACPPATLDIVAKANNRTGGGGLYVHESMANQFAMTTGRLPEGMISFRDAADLRRQLSERQPQNTEFQIATNGTMVAGMQGHGLHAQTVRMENGQLVFGNNWTREHNHRVYHDNFVNAVTDSTKWGDYRYQVGPDGQRRERDWKNEFMDDERNKSPQDRNENDARKQLEEQQKKLEEQKKKEEDQKKQEELQKKLDKMNQYQAARAQWLSNLTAAQAGKDLAKVEKLLATEPRLLD